MEIERAFCDGTGKVVAKCKVKWVGFTAKGSAVLTRFGLDDKEIFSISSPPDGIFIWEGKPEPDSSSCYGIRAFLVGAAMNAGVTLGPIDLAPIDLIIRDLADQLEIARKSVTAESSG